MNYFKNIRHALNLSQQELASMLGVTQKAVSRYEADDYEIPENIKYLLESKLHVNLEYLNTGTGDIFNIPESIAGYKESWQQILSYVFQMNQDELEQLIKYLQSFEFHNM